ncbi:MAG TPA: ThuA domain-containing protein, partial [Candidatus Dormibacteraeota bacterium]|nr:ThuA domain-containing protein [Candidatus Dormibacteraeota bacterium]
MQTFSFTRITRTLKTFWGQTIVSLACLLISTSFAASPKPLRILLITGGCCHDYAHQKDILKDGITQRANVQIEQIHTGDTTTHPPLAILGNPDYAKGYDLVIHDECAADISDPEKVEAVLKPHRDGLPGVNLHCAMHSYRIGNPNDKVEPGTPHGLWFDYIGIQSSAHGAQLPISIRFTAKDSPMIHGLADWTTINEELYNNIHIFDNTKPLAHGSQVVKSGNGEKTNDVVVVWTNEYGPKKAKVFSTTIGHNNATVQDPRYLDLVTRGILWATGHLKDDGTPADGYGPKK